MSFLVNSKSSTNSSRNDDFYNFMDSLISTYVPAFLGPKETKHAREHLKLFLRLVMSLYDPIAHEPGTSRNDQLLRFAHALEASESLHQVMTYWVQSRDGSITFNDLRLGPKGLYVEPVERSVLFNSTVLVDQSRPIQTLNISNIQDFHSTQSVNQEIHFNSGHVNEATRNQTVSMGINQHGDTRINSERSSSNSKSLSARCKLKLPRTPRRLCPKYRPFDIRRNAIKIVANGSSITQAATNQKDLFSVQPINSNQENEDIRLVFIKHLLNQNRLLSEKLLSYEKDDAKKVNVSTRNDRSETQSTEQEFQTNEINNATQSIQSNVNIINVSLKIYF